MNRNRIFAGISLITMSVLIFELGLTRIFSATMYYHFAFMAISLALFGSGASGVFIYTIQRRLALVLYGRVAWPGVSILLCHKFNRPLRGSDASSGAGRNGPKFPHSRHHLRSDHIALLLCRVCHLARGNQVC